MNWKHTLVAGAGTGTILAALSALIMVKIGIDPGSLLGLLVIVCGLVLVSGLAMKKIFQVLGHSDISLKVLISIAFLTFIIPLFGPIFGAPNSKLTTLLQIVVIGTVGGLVWSIPFALRSVSKNRGNSHASEE